MDVFNALRKIIIIIYVRCYHAVKRSKTLTGNGIMNIISLFLLMFVWAYKNTYLIWLNKWYPETVPLSFVRTMGSLSWEVHFLILSTPLLAIIIYILSYGSIKKMKRVTKALRKAGLKNALGTQPIAVDVVNLTSFRHKVIVDTHGVPIEDFQKKKNAIRASLNSQVESIVEQSQPKFVELFLTNQLLPQKVAYASVCAKASKSGEFVVGQSHGETITQNLFDLPHMLVAGSTGMGKSCFLRQMLLNLLENTPNLQVYALDFKQGISMKPFREHPRVTVIKDIFEAVEILEKIQCEMQERFKILEKGDDDVIDPQKHKKDPILILIDECSMLYDFSRKTDLQRKSSLKATQITDEIAKLSRAARIHLVLGTQKISKHTVSTHIQENIEGRLCFKVISVQGSALVIGTKAARDLPKIAGRAISKVGVDMDEVQTPFISTEEIKERMRKFISSSSKPLEKPPEKLTSEGKHNDSVGSFSAPIDTSQSQKVEIHGE